ncbi:MAG: flagellar biosynthesis protein FlaG [Methylophilaceae bacterium 17-43-7]|jgi:flagellar protein FlaG|nr:MAG: flagellar biosynthesis protein FlaG [Methylophilales bacterium 28-44-11]OYY99598.1 MAG: flagellar biosynthesis protein FlaG [Methylophilales bacterium 16-45-7]OYZ69716.1 MAG: flagellar biosynthesis protein FlaG [Methylophilaceae bacterium 17-43-7]
MFQSSIDAYGKGKLPGVAANQTIQATSGLKVVSKPQEPEVPETEFDKATLTGAVQKLNDYVAPALQTIQFSIDQESERIVVKVVDTATQKVLRQIPNEEVMAITKTLDKLQGLVIRQTA